MGGLVFIDCFPLNDFLVAHFQDRQDTHVHCTFGEIDQLIELLILIV